MPRSLNSDVLLLILREVVFQYHRKPFEWLGTILAVCLVNRAWHADFRIELARCLVLRSPGLGLMDLEQFRSVEHFAALEDGIHPSTAIALQAIAPQLRTLYLECSPHAHLSPIPESPNQGYEVPSWAGNMPRLHTAILLAMEKHLEGVGVWAWLSRLDPACWPKLRQLVVHNFGAHQLPGIDSLEHLVLIWDNRLAPWQDLVGWDLLHRFPKLVTLVMVYSRDALSAPSEDTLCLQAKRNVARSDGCKHVDLRDVIVDIDDEELRYWVRGKSWTGEIWECGSLGRKWADITEAEVRQEAARYQASVLAQARLYLVGRK